jgi:hypothetical protein
MDVKKKGYRYGFERFNRKRAKQGSLGSNRTALRVVNQTY